MSNAETLAAHTNGLQINEALINTLVAKRNWNISAGALLRSIANQKPTQTSINEFTHDALHFRGGISCTLVHGTIEKAKAANDDKDDTYTSIREAGFNRSLFKNHAGFTSFLEKASAGDIFIGSSLHQCTKASEKGLISILVIEKGNALKDVPSNIIVIEDVLGFITQPLKIRREKEERASAEVWKNHYRGSGASGCLLSPFVKVAHGIGFVARRTPVLKKAFQKTNGKDEDTTPEGPAATAL